MNSYDIGNLVRISVTFEDDAGVTDPSVVKCQVRTPVSAPTTYTYGTDVAVMRESKGIYYMDIDTPYVGTYRYRWYSTGTGQAADEGEFAIITNGF